MARDYDTILVNIKPSETVGFRSPGMQQRLGSARLVSDLGDEEHDVSGISVKVEA